MTKIKMLAAAVAVAGVSTMAGAAAPYPPAAPTIYNGGPAASNVASTNMSAQERASYALLESMLQLAEAKIHASGCTPLALKLSVYSNSAPALTEGYATLGIGSTAVKLKAVAKAAPTYQGQKFDITTDKDGEIGGYPIGGLIAEHAFNAANNLMVGIMKNVTATSVNWQDNFFQGTVIKDFYMGESGKPGAYNIFDWGLQSLDKGGFPIEKYWQRSKVRRSDGGNGKTAFVKDRLVGPSPCRIAIFLDGQNAPLSLIFYQSGILKIQTLKPSEVTPGVAGEPEEIDAVDTI